MLIVSNLGGRDEAVANMLVQNVLAGALVLTAASLLAYKQITALTRARVDDPTHSRATILTITAGVVFGVMVTLTSVGAGALGIVALLYLYPRPQFRALSAPMSPMPCR